MDRAGAKVPYPLALVAIGGLISSTALNLFFVPALYYVFGETQNITHEE